MVRKFRKDFKTCYKTPIETLLPFERFISDQSSSSIILIISIVIALVIANSPLSSYYFELFETPLSIGIGNFILEKPLLLWINDGLMAIFFFLVGLEVKREILTGELSEFELIKLPAVAAIGGMIVPISFFVLFNLNQPTMRGWAIPMATDIAMLLGLLALFGNRVPTYLKVFLTSMAIIDDIASIFVIAIFFTTSIKMEFLVFALFLILILIAFNRLAIRQSYLYIFIGVFLWVALLKAGVHATITGIILALLIPATKKLDIHEFRVLAQSVLNTLAYDDPEKDPEITPEAYLASIQTLEQGCHDIQPPLYRLEFSIQPWILYIIIPIFAFANSGLKIQSVSINSLLSPLSLGIIAGLVLGKTIGIILFTWFATKSGYAKVPKDITLDIIYSASWLAGIGLTMSFFITSLAFTEVAITINARISVLIASALAAMIGLFLLNRSLPEASEIESETICDDNDDLFE